MLRSAGTRLRIRSILLAAACCAAVPASPATGATVSSTESVLTYAAGAGEADRASFA